MTQGPAATGTHDTSAAAQDGWPGSYDGLHGDGFAVQRWRRYVPAPSTGTLVAVLVAFMLGGLVVAAADELAATAEPAPVHALS